MKKCLLTAMLLFMSALPGRAADWYDPEGWLDKDETRIRAEWWNETAAAVDGRDQYSGIYGFDSGLRNRDWNWGYGYDYNTVDWYEYKDPFSKWYQKEDSGWL